MSLKWGSKPWRIWSSHWQNKASVFGYRLPIALILAIIFGAGIGYLLTNIYLKMLTLSYMWTQTSYA